VCILPQQGTAHAPHLRLAAAQASEQRLARRLLDGVPRVLGNILRGGLGAPEEPAQALGRLPATTQPNNITLHVHARGPNLPCTQLGHCRTKGGCCTTAPLTGRRLQKRFQRDAASDGYRQLSSVG